MIEISLIVLLIIYAVLVAIFVIFTLINLYHLGFYGFIGFPGFLVTFIFLAIAVLVFFITYKYASPIDWNQPLINLGEDNIYQPIN